MTVTTRPRAAMARSIAIVGAMAMLLAWLPSASTAHADAHEAGEVRRVGGPERAATAALLAQDGFPQGATTAMLAREDLFPDALAGAHIAGARTAPILLSRTDLLPQHTRDMLNRLGVRNIILLGGTAAIGTEVENQLRAANYNVSRVGGLNRFDTARLIAETVGTAGSAPGTDGTPRRTAVLASGENFPDALASGPFSFGGRHPILLSAQARLSPEARQALTNPALGIQQVIIPGGFAAVSEQVENEVRALGITTVRFRGAERTQTARMMADYTMEALGWTLDVTAGRTQINLARGNDFPDALTLGPRAGVFSSVIVLTQTPEVIGADTSNFIFGNCARIRTITIAGGTAAVSADAAARAASLAKCATGISVEPRDSVNRPGETHTVTATATQENPEPAAGAVVRFELYREVTAQPTPPTGFYRENGRFFRFVEVETATADAQGRATFAYTHDAEVDDRIIACTPPDNALVPKEQATSCVSDAGDPRQTMTWASAVARNLWRTGTHSFAVDMSAEQEVAADGTRPDPDPAETESTGTADLVIDTDENRVCFALEVNRGPGSGEYAAAHIHEAPAGENGDIVVPLEAPDEDTDSALGCADVDPEDFDVSEITDDPASFYVNVHTTEFPAGLVRGQLA